MEILSNFSTSLTHRTTEVQFIATLAASPFNICEENKNKIKDQLYSVSVIGYSANKHQNF